MSILIAYGGKYGTTKKCAELLSELLPESRVVDLKAAKHPDIGEFDAVIVGGCVRYGLLNRSVKNFVLRNVQTLRKKVTAYYLCCGFPSNAQQYFNTNFPKLALEHACSKECFGGAFDPSVMSGFDKFVLKVVTSNTEVKKQHKEPEINMDALRKLADDVKKALQNT